MWVDCPLQVSQRGQLSLSSFWGQYMSSKLESDVCYHVRVANLVKATEVTAGLAESNGSLPPCGWLNITCGLTACTPGSALGPMLGNEYWQNLTFYLTFQHHRHYCLVPVLLYYWCDCVPLVCGSRMCQQAISSQDWRQNTATRDGLSIRCSWHHPCQHQQPSTARPTPRSIDPPTPVWHPAASIPVHLRASTMVCATHLIYLLIYLLIYWLS